jgi:hypothetical protein
MPFSEVLMRKNIIILLFLCANILSCISTSYYKTGNELPPLTSDEEVTIFTSSKPVKKYEIIGLLRIRGSREDKRIEKAKELAKAKGGNGIIAREIGIVTEPGTEKVIEKIGTSTYETQEFIVIKLEGERFVVKNEKSGERLEEAKDNISEIQSELKTSGSSNIPALDYKTIPRATYKQLITNYKSLNGKLFRGTLYPKKIYKIPSSFKLEPGTGDRLVLLTTKRGTGKLYLIINKNNIPAVRNKISSGDLLDFVYTPVQTYTAKTGKHPVLKLVEEITVVK